MTTTQNVSQVLFMPQYRLLCKAQYRVKIHNKSSETSGGNHTRRSGPCDDIKHAIIGQTYGLLAICS